MRKATPSLIVPLCVLLLGSCTLRPDPVHPSTPAPIIELDEIFYSNPQRLGDARQAHEQMQAPEASLISLSLMQGEYLVEVVAQPGAVPPYARVLMANMETLFFELVT
ncbi:MAG TPA: hypothetical protein VJK02_14515, partial [Anaerolineales bacterium]|nr:hypothetical protein [Anaerolineales bacterium]